ncbi:hypothetical protein ES5_10856, partial [Dietzia cinnamea P4]
MNPAVLLLAAAVCVAPWRPRAADRLDAVLPDPDVARARHRGMQGRPRGVATSAAAVTGRIASPAAPLLAPLTRRRPAPADTEVLAHLLDLLAVALVAGLPTPDALAAVADAVEHSDPDAAEPLRAAA